MVTEIKSKYYTCLNPIALAYPFGSAGLTGCQSFDLDHQKLLSVKTRSSIINTQTIRDNIHEANKATIRTVHQPYKNSMKSLQNDSTHRYDLTDVKITKIGVTTEKL